MKIQEILIVKNSQEQYGISTEDINQISRVPKLMSLPLKPVGMRGLCSMGGNVVCVLDINLLLGMSSINYDDPKTKLLSLNDEHSSNALLVSEIYNTVEIDEDKIEYIETKNDPVIAIYKHDNSLIQVLSLDVLIAQINRVVIAPKEVKNGKIKLEKTTEEDARRFLIFYMQSEKFALDIDYLQEIVLADRDFTDIVGSSDEVLGLIRLRDELLLVIDLREYYGFEAKSSDKNRILVVLYKGKRIGLLIDSVIDIKNILIKNIEYMSNDSTEVRISGVIHNNNSLISFFDHEILEKILDENEAYIESTSEHEILEANLAETLEVIVFKLSSKEYAFKVDNVSEIIDIVKSTEIAYSEDFIDGIINLRGEIVTIVSLYKKLNIPTLINEDSKIIVCNIDDNRIGFIVDEVSDILNVHEKDIYETDEETLFNRILHLDDGKRLVLSIDLDKILSKKEL